MQIYVYFIDIFLNFLYMHIICNIENCQYFINMRSLYIYIYINCSLKSLTFDLRQELMFTVLSISNMLVSQHIENKAMCQL